MAVAAELCPIAVEEIPLAVAVQPSAVAESPAVEFVPTAVEVAVEATAPSASPVMKLVPVNWPCAGEIESHPSSMAQAIGTAARASCRHHWSPLAIFMSDLHFLLISSCCQLICSLAVQIAPSLGPR